MEICGSNISKAWNRQDMAATWDSLVNQDGTLYLLGLLGFKAADAILLVTARELYLVDEHLAGPAALAA